MTFTLNTRSAAIANMINGINGTTFATIMTETPIALKAANKHITATKRSVLNVQLFNNVRDVTAIYENAVKRSANKIDGNENPESFKASSASYIHHDDCYSIAQNKKSDQQYLSYILNKSISAEYFINDEPALKADVAELCTPSTAKRMMDNSGLIHNKTNDIVHTVKTATVKVENIISINANKQTLVF